MADTNRDMDDSTDHAHAHDDIAATAAGPAANQGAHFQDGGDIFEHLLQDMADADDIYSAEFVALNNSGVTGHALLFTHGDQLTVVTSADGLEANTHAFHIHGLPDGMDSTVPTLAQDADHDGFVELAEGAVTYGPIILNLTTNPDQSVEVPPGALRADLAFPTVGADGHLLYAQTFTFDGTGQSNAIADMLQPLENRHMVLHGETVAQGSGAGSTGEVEGSAGYKAVLPVANAEIVHETTQLGAQLALLNLFNHHDDMAQQHHADYPMMG